MKKQKDKMTLRGYQTALGIARREENALRRELIRQRKRAEAAEEEHRLALANIQHLRGILGEFCPQREKLKYRRAIVVKVLDDREFRPIPPMHFRISARQTFGRLNHEMGYVFELAIPDGAQLDYGNAHVVHRALHELVDFVEKNPRGGGIEVEDAFTGGAK